jgi:hypothetical protein
VITSIILGVSEQEFDAVRRLLSRSKRMPRNWRVFALTGRRIQLAHMEKAQVAQRRLNLPLGHEDGALDLGFVGSVLI